MMTIRDTLGSRRSTHGDYTDHARVTQELKHVMEREVGWRKLNACQREALAVIAHKIGRILVGNPHFHDHWHDIAGYATLVADRVNPADEELFISGTPDDGGHHAQQEEE
jgi:hypothetical protein